MKAVLLYERCTITIFPDRSNGDAMEIQGSLQNTMLHSLRTLNLMVRRRSGNRLTSIFRDLFPVCTCSTLRHFSGQNNSRKKFFSVNFPGNFFYFPNYFPEKYLAGTNSLQRYRSCLHHRMHLPFTSIPTSHTFLKKPPRTIADPMFTTPQIRAFSSPRFPDSPNSGSIWVSMTPCSIENSWSISPNTGSIRMSDTTKIGIL